VLAESHSRDANPISVLPEWNFKGDEQGTGGVDVSPVYYEIIEGQVEDKLHREKQPFRASIQGSVKLRPGAFKQT